MNLNILGLSLKRLARLEDAYDSFYKLHAILKNNPEVIYHIADIQEQLEDNSQAQEWYMQVMLRGVNSLLGKLES